MAAMDGGHHPDVMGKPTTGAHDPVKESSCEKGHHAPENVPPFSLYGKVLLLEADKKYYRQEADGDLLGPEAAEEQKCSKDIVARFLFAVSQEK